MELEQNETFYKAMQEVDVSGKDAASNMKAVFANSGVPSYVQNMEIILGDGNAIARTTKNLYLSGYDYLKSTKGTVEVNGENVKKVSVITSMLTYFKSLCWSDARVINKTQINLLGVTLLLIFLFQSFIFFFQYLKRLFYIMVLAIMAPLFVLYDFLMG